MQQDLLRTVKRKRFYGQAFKFAQQAYRNALTTLPAHHPEVFHAIKNLAMINKALGQETLADSLFQKGFQVLKNNFGLSTMRSNSPLDYYGGICYPVEESQAYHNICPRALYIAVNVPERNDGSVVTTNQWDPTREYQRMIFIWEDVLNSQMPRLIATNVLSMVFSKSLLNDFETLINRRLQRFEDKIKMDDLGDVLRKWKSYCQPQGQQAAAVDEETRQDLEGIQSFQKRLRYLQSKQSTKSAELHAEADIPDSGVYLSEGKNLANLPDLTGMIAQPDRRRFIEELFRNKEGDFEELIGSLNSTHDWKDAARHIDNYFEESGVNPYTRTALSFSDLVYSRYFPMVEKGR